MRQLAFDLTIVREGWRDIPGYEGLYRISDQGRIQHAAYRGGRDGKRYKPGMPKKSSHHKSEYVYISLTSREGIETKHYIHRLVMAAFCPIENADDLDVNHKNGNKADNELSNLEWMSHRENIIHAREFLKAWPARQDMDLSKKLTDDDVRQIRYLRSTGMFQTTIAKKYGVSHTTVSLIVRRKAWAHVA